MGLGLGTFNYTGDLVRTYNFKYSKPAATVFYRSNLSKVVSFRVGVTAGKIGASEEPIDAFATHETHPLICSCSKPRPLWSIIF